MIFGRKTSANEFTAFFQRVKLLDLSPIAYQLMQSKSGPQWTQPQTVQAITHYIAFLGLIDRYRHFQLAPTHEIDTVWHQHILDTSKYAADCQLLFGRFVHHFPYFGTRNQEDQRRLYQASVRTQVLLCQHFGIDLSSGRIKQICDCEPLLAGDFADSMQWNQQRPGSELNISEPVQSFLESLESTFSLELEVTHV